MNLVPSPICRCLHHGPGFHAKFVGAAFPNGASKDEKGCHVFQKSSGNLAAKGRLTGSVCDKIGRIKMIGKVQRFDICASDPDRGPEVTMIRHHLPIEPCRRTRSCQDIFHDKEKKNTYK